MYRIELGPDDIGVFRSVEEMATGIKTGVITPNARIYHSASDKWLPIEFHPHYKRAREMAAGGVPPAPPTPVPVRALGSELPKRPQLPTPAAVAGLPLIDVGPTRTPKLELIDTSVGAEATPAPEPAPTAAPTVAGAASEPEFAAAAPAPELEVEHPAPPAAASTAAVTSSEPELEAYQPPAASEVEFVHHAREPEPAPIPLVAAPALLRAPVLPEPKPLPAPVLITAPASLPEPEREAIFLAAREAPEAEDAPDAPAEPVATLEPELEAAKIAAPLPAFQLPKVDLRLPQRRRPALVAAATVVLAVSTHFALASGKPRLELGVGVPLPEFGPRPARAERPSQNAPANATVLPASVPARGSPSFGGASAFAEPKPVTEVAPPPAADTAPASVPEVAPPPKVAIAAPKLTAAPSLEGDLKSAAGLVARYELAHAAARAELENGLKTAGFANLFATARLQPGGLRAARASVGTASAYVQRYRRREAEIEQAYRDTFNLLAGRNKWSDGQRRTWDGRKLRQEHPEIAKLSGFLLQSLDSLYGLLSAQEGAYRLGEGTITFDDAAASRAYAELRPWLDRRAHAWADVDSAEPTTAARILQAMGTVKLPEGGSL
jgi:hypothetical protein